MVFVQTQLVCNGLCHRLGVAGQHDGLADTGVLELPDGLGTVGFDHVGDEQRTGILAVNGHMDHGADLVPLGDGEIQLVHQAGVAHGDSFAVHLGGHAVAAQLLHIGDAVLVDLFAVGGLDAEGDGVLGPAFGEGSGLHQRVFAYPIGGMDAHHLECTLRQGAGLVKDHNTGIGQLFEVGRALDEDAAGTGTADAAEEAQRDRDDQCAGAGDDEEGQGAVDPVAEAGRLPHQQQNEGREEGQCQCAVADRRGVDPGKAGDKVLGARLFHAGIFHQIEDLGDGGFTEFLGGADLQQTGHVDTTADDCIAGPDIPGQAFAGQGSRIQSRGTLDDYTVDGDPLAGLHHDEGADLDFVGIHLLQLAVCTLDVGVIRADIHQRADVLAALAHRHALEQLADLVEEDDGAALDVIAQCKRTYGGNCHQEAFIKGLAVLDALQSLAQDIPADHQIGDQVEHQLHRFRKFGQQLQDQHQNRGSDDLIEHLFLFLVHLQSLLLAFPAAMTFGGGRSFNTFSPRKKLFHAFPRVFHGLFPEKRTFLRFFFPFSAKRVENPVENVENRLIFPHISRFRFKKLP